MLDGLTKLVTGSQGILLLVVSLLFTVSFVVFVSVVISFLLKRARGDAGGMKQAGDMLWWSVFAMFIMVAVWGITAFLSQNLGIGVGGCAPRPSAIPGQPAITDCGSAGSGYSSGAAANCSATSNRPAGCACTSSAICKSGLSCVSGSCKVVINPVSTNPAQSGGGANQCSANSDCGAFGNVCVNNKCVSGNQNATNQCGANGGITAANGDVLYCNKGSAGQPCVQGSCSTGFSCDVPDTGTSYGTCKSI